MKANKLVKRLFWLIEKLIAHLEWYVNSPDNKELISMMADDMVSCKKWLEVR